MASDQTPGEELDELVNTLLDEHGIDTVEIEIIAEPRVQLDDEATEFDQTKVERSVSTARSREFAPNGWHFKPEYDVFYRNVIDKYRLQTEETIGSD